MLVKIVGLLAISLLITGTVDAGEPTGTQLCSCICPAGQFGTSTNDTNWTELELPSEFFGTFSLHHGRGFDKFISWFFNSTNNPYHAKMMVSFKPVTENSFHFILLANDREQIRAHINLKNRTESQLKANVAVRNKTFYFSEQLIHIDQEGFLVLAPNPNIPNLSPPKAQFLIFKRTTKQRNTRGTSDVLPDKFYGNFELDRSENFDEYMTAKGYGWFTRKLVAFATFKKIFARTANKHLFDYSNLTSKKDVFYKNVGLGKKFEGEGLDSTKHEITFTLKDGHLFEHHKPLEAGEAKEETYEYYFDGDILLQKMSFNGVEGRRYYKKTA